MADRAIDPGDAADIRTSLRHRLRECMRARDKAAVQAIRTALAAIENAEAQPADDVSQTELLLGASTSVDVPRRVVSDGDARALVAAEIDDLRAAADHHRSIGAAESAATLERQAGVLGEILRPAR